VSEDGSQRWRFRLPRDEIGYVRFIVEAYGGVVQMTSRAGRGEVTWIVPESRVDEARELARALAAEIPFERLGEAAR